MEQSHAIRNTVITLAMLLAVGGFIAFLANQAVAQDQGDATSTEATTTEQAPFETQTGTTTSPFEAGTLQETDSFPAPMVLDVDNAGNVLVRGVVQSVGTDSLVLDSWGGSWTIQFDEESVIVPSGPEGLNDPSEVSVGDFVGVDGVITAEDDMIVTATFARDWTTNPYTGPDAPTTTGTGTTTDTGINETSTTAPGSLESNIGTPGTEGTAAPTDDTTLGTENVGAADGATSATGTEPGMTVWSGTASNIGYNSFTLTDEFGNAYEVMTGGAEVLDQNGNDAHSVFFGLQIDDGAFVTVDGTQTDGSAIEATTVQVE